MDDQYDLCVIGGGPGGYVAAIRAAQLGMRAVLVEKSRLGGTCGILGCVPTKTLLRSAHVFMDVKRASIFGVSTSEVKIDHDAIVRRMNTVVDRLSNGVQFLLKSNHVDLVKGRGRLVEQGLVRVLDESGNEIFLKAKNTIVATGSTPPSPRIEGIRGANVLNNEDALALKELPSSMAIIGGGPEGCEFATFYGKLGVEVTIVEMMPRLLPTEDHEIGPRIQQLFERENMKIILGMKVSSIIDGDGEKVIVGHVDGSDKRVSAEKVLVSVGRKPNSEGLGLEDLGVRMDNERIVVNEKMQTNVPGVYAIGDVTGGLFAHEAMEEGVVAVENIAGRELTMDHSAIPRCVYTIPEVAAVGLAEQEAKERGYDVRIGRFAFSASGRALTLGDTEGFVKVIIDTSSRRLLGVHMIGPSVSDMISEATLAMKLKARAEDIVATIHPHPTLSEPFREAVLDADKLAIHRVR